MIGDPFAEVFGPGAPASRRPDNWPPHPAALDDDDLLRWCESARERGGGPGGQHRNKVETAVVLVHRPTGLRGAAAERRSVRENKPVALRRLRLNLAVHHREPVPPGEARTELWKRRTRSGRVVVSERHRDFAAVLAEVMDMLADRGWEPRRAATRLETTPTQIIKLLKVHPPALGEANRQRQSRGLHPLK